MIGTDYSDHTYEMDYDQVILNYGAMPLDELFFDLKPLSSNAGEVDQSALILRQVQEVSWNEAGKLQLFRIGDAVSARNTHASIYDALRLMKGI